MNSLVCLRLYIKISLTIIYLATHKSFRPTINSASKAATSPTTAHGYMMHIPYMI
jgi:hypothetical protein